MLGKGKVLLESLIRRLVLGLLEEDEIEIAGRLRLGGEQLRKLGVVLHAVEDQVL